jgi:hypothetical protein
MVFLCPMELQFLTESRGGPGGKWEKKISTTRDGAEEMKVQFFLIFLK